jgi:hypothetical protein
MIPTVLQSQEVVPDGVDGCTFFDSHYVLRLWPATSTMTSSLWVTTRSWNRPTITESATKAESAKRPSIATHRESRDSVDSRDSLTILHTVCTLIALTFADLSEHHTASRVYYLTKTEI